MRLLYQRCQVAAFLATISLSAAAEDVRVLAFSFALPDGWHVEGQGGDLVTATGAPVGIGPPSLVAEACAPSDRAACDRLRPRKGWPPCKQSSPARRSGNDITETTYICPPEASGGKVVLSGTTIFEAQGAVLTVTYISMEQKPEAFFENVRQSLKFKPS